MISCLCPNAGVILFVSVRWISLGHFFRFEVRSFSLMSDMFFVTQSFGRLLRAFAEMAFSRGLRVSAISAQLHRWAKVVERRVWPHKSILLHFCQPASLKNQQSGDQQSALKLQTIERLNDIKTDELFSMTTKELESILRVPAEARMVYSYLRR